MDKRIELKDKQAVSIRTDIHPGDIGSIIYLHGTLYAKEYGFNHTFEPYVAMPLSEFVNKQTSRDKLWIVDKNEEVMGSVAIVNCPGNIAQLRWLIVHPDLRGYGIGKKLVKEALSFCRAQNYASVFLWTIDFLNAALKLYTSAGFRMTESKTHKVWGRLLTEERYELRLNPK